MSACALGISGKRVKFRIAMPNFVSFVLAILSSPPFGWIVARPGSKSEIRFTLGRRAGRISDSQAALAS
jgi:hypothetical protein